MHTFCNHTLYCVGQRRSPQHLSTGFIVCFLPLWPCTTVRFKPINCCSSTYLVCSHIFLCKLHLHLHTAHAPSNVDCVTMFVHMYVQTNECAYCVHLCRCMPACCTQQPNPLPLATLTHYCSWWQSATMVQRGWREQNNLLTFTGRLTLASSRFVPWHSLTKWPEPHPI